MAEKDGDGDRDRDSVWLLWGSLGTSLPPPQTCGLCDGDTGALLSAPSSHPATLRPVPAVGKRRLCVLRGPGADPRWAEPLSEVCPRPGQRCPGRAAACPGTAVPPGAGWRQRPAALSVTCAGEEL